MLRQFPIKSSGSQNGKIKEKDRPTEDQLESIMDLKGDALENAYLYYFGYEELGINRTYETMVFKAIKQEDPACQCCPWLQSGSDLYCDGYNDAVAAFQGHIATCRKFQEEPHGSIIEDS